MRTLSTWTLVNRTGWLRYRSYLHQTKGIFEYRDTEIQRHREMYLKPPEFGIRKDILLKGQINTQLSEEEQLPEDISTYTALHSFGTILEHKRVPESYIGFALGHSRKSVTDSYIEEYSVEDRKQYNGLLQF